MASRYGGRSSINGIRESGERRWSSDWGCRLCSPCKQLFYTIRLLQGVHYWRPSESVTSSSWKTIGFSSRSLFKLYVIKLCREKIMKSEETRIRKQTRTTLLSAGTSGASRYRDRRDPNGVLLPTSLVYYRSMNLSRCLLLNLTNGKKVKVKVAFWSIFNTEAIWPIVFLLPMSSRIHLQRRNSSYRCARPLPAKAGSITKFC